MEIENLVVILISLIVKSTSEIFRKWKESSLLHQNLCCHKTAGRLHYGITLLQRNSSTIFRCIFWNFQEHLICWTFATICFWWTMLVEITRYNVCKFLLHNDSKIWYSRNKKQHCSEQLTVIKSFYVCWYGRFSAERASIWCIFKDRLGVNNLKNKN